MFSSDTLSWPPNTRCSQRAQQRAGDRGKHQQKRTHCVCLWIGKVLPVLYIVARHRLGQCAVTAYMLMRYAQRSAVRAPILAIMTAAALMVVLHCIQAATAAPVPVLFVTQHGEEDPSDPTNAVQVRAALPLSARAIPSYRKLLVDRAAHRKSLSRTDALTQLPWYLNLMHLHLKGLTQRATKATKHVERCF